MLWTRVALAVTLLALLAPAARGASVSGELTFAGDARVGGPAEIRAGRGILDLAWQLERDGGVELEWGAARGSLVEWTYTYFADRAFGHDLGASVRNTTLAFGPGRAEGLRCDGPCAALAFVDDATRGSLAMSGDARGSLAPLVDPPRYVAGAPYANASSFYYPVPVGWYRAWANQSPSERGTLDLDAASARAEGDLALFLYGGEITFKDENGATARYETGKKVERVMGPGGVALREDVSVRFLVVRFENATLHVRDARHVALLAGELDVSLHGRIEALDASGTVAIEGEPHRLASETVAIQGDLALGWRASAPSAPLAGEAPTTTLRLAGDADLARLGAALHRDGSRALATASLAALLVALAALATCAALYSRIASERLLEHPARQRIVELAQVEPGVSVGRLARILGVGETVARYHLRRLEANRYVVTRRSGREKGIFPAEVDPDTVPSMPHSETRVALERALAETHAAPTQADLAGRLGLSRRLVSYHLSVLKDAGLVTVEPGWPTRYRAAPQLVLKHGAAAARAR